MSSTDGVFWARYPALALSALLVFRQGTGEADPIQLDQYYSPQRAWVNLLWINTGLAPGRAGQGEARLGEARQGWARQGEARRGELGEARHSSQELALHAWFVLTYRPELICFVGGDFPLVKYIMATSSCGWISSQNCFP